MTPRPVLSQQYVFALAVLIASWIFAGCLAFLVGAKIARRRWG